MEKPVLKVFLMNEDAVFPSKRDEDSGYDIYTTQKEDVVLLHGEKFNFPTGLKTEVAKEWGIILREKGGMGNKNIGLRAGVVDSGYRGEMFVIMTNEDPKPVVFTRNPENYSALEKTGKATIVNMNKSITQAMIVYTPDCKVLKLSSESEFSDSERGNGSKGSTRK